MAYNIHVVFLMAGLNPVRATVKAFEEVDKETIVSPSSPSPLLFESPGDGVAVFCIVFEKIHCHPSLRSQSVSVRGEVTHIHAAMGTTQAAPKGFFGAMRQRGMGGAKCGSTAATLLLLPGIAGQSACSLD